ncbi:DUF3426 domain-containing protein [Variovorax arabinosiphilus]|uniref:DUF3426 domain-containing protein n=1 Tax=Variovorax arabinosiphilus TaxID=3053498 RepID=UPI00257549D1|nr:MULTISPECIES: DUF3426 domain-containing protein [unclassified Variovorax]MDM0122482.1 DUF3426 domain-containing protein [Variovorax sp. J2L1-78]MDM0130989.1 DUF3426 domain-containing protein [Variovorax sp. J2L1-63]MDM0235245.1 DUF3426 domain-containing protein [Variovorax sp. J2R1-6]
MSLATRCPECGTTFKVVRDQLRISDGWVRCGRCSHVFDGTEHLHDTEAVAPDGGPAATVDDVSRGPALPSPEASAPSAFVGDDAEPASTASDAAPAPETPRPVATPTLADIDFFNDALSRLQRGAPSFDDDAPAPTSVPTVITDHIPQPPRTQPVTLEAPSLGWPSFTGYAPTTPVPVIAFPADDAPTSSSAAPQAIDTWSRLPSLHLGDVPRRAEAPVPAAVPDTDDAQFQKALRRARVKSAKIARSRAKARDSQPAAVVMTASEPVEPPPAASELPVAAARRRVSRAGDVPHRRGFRPGWPWRMLSVVALLGLVAQMLYQERSAIVARQPSWRPAFASACEVLGCQLAALQRIADITIDGASFVREKGGEGYQLSFTLRNRADLPLAMPAVELSLIDLQERTVVRRVLRPADYGAPAVIAARGERTALLPMALVGGDAAALPRVAGFHLDAFYP